MIVGHPARREGVVPGGFVRAKASHRGGVALWPRPFRKRPMPVWAPLEIGAGTPTPSDPPVRRCELCGIIFRFVIAPLPRSAPWLLLRGAPLWAPGPRHESHPQPSPSYRPVAWRGAPSGGLDMGIDSRRVAVEQPGRCFREAVRLVLVSWVNRVRGLVSCSAAFQKSSRLRLRLRCSDFSHAALRARHTCWRWQWGPAREAGSVHPVQVRPGRHMAGDLRLPEAAGRDAQIWSHRPWLRPPGGLRLAPGGAPNPNPEGSERGLGSAVTRANGGG